MRPTSPTLAESHEFLRASVSTASSRSSATPPASGSPAALTSPASPPSPASSASKSSVSLKTKDSSSKGFDSKTTFYSPQRKPLEINFLYVGLVFLVAFGLIGALIAGYLVGIEVYDADVTTAGLYGTILISQYLIQRSCAIFNRVDVDRIVRDRKEKASLFDQDVEKGVVHRTPHTSLLNPDAECSIAVVGSREDVDAWRYCLRSLQKQTLPAKVTVAVVDGNDEPDLSMVQAFVEEFASYRACHIHLPLLLSDLHRNVYSEAVPTDNRWFLVKWWHGLIGKHRPGHIDAIKVARQAVIDQVMDWEEEWNISSNEAVIFSQPHGSKRTAMYTAFVMSLYVFKTRDSIFTTDADTVVKADALDEMLTLLRSSEAIGGVTGDVKIWTRRESLLARLFSVCYWLAFNAERARQSVWRCVGCLPGPMSMYRSCDLETILSPWNLQTIGGDHQLSDELLNQGLHTRYTHRTWCDSDSPTLYGRWAAQQIAWRRSGFREAFWSPSSLTCQPLCMLVEVTTQAVYPFLVIAIALLFLHDPGRDQWRPVIWLFTFIGAAYFKTFLAIIHSWDLRLLLFNLYGFMHFLELLPSKVRALLGMDQTACGTAARSSTARKACQILSARSFQVIHLAIWYSAVFACFGLYLVKLFQHPLYFLVVFIAALPPMFLFWQPGVYKTGFASMLNFGWSRRRQATTDGATRVTADQEENMSSVSSTGKRLNMTRRKRRQMLEAASLSMERPTLERM